MTVFFDQGLTDEEYTAHGTDDRIVNRFACYEAEPVIAIAQAEDENQQVPILVSESKCFHT